MVQPHSFNSCKNKFDRSEAIQKGNSNLFDPISTWCNILSTSALLCGIVFHCSRVLYLNNESHWVKKRYN